ncbi:MAG: pyridoxamine 5'-phosphate oxidase family protein [Blastocatellia bacterium]
MTSWAQVAAVAPALASFGKQRLEHRIAYLATIRPDGSPRVHPVSPFLAEDRLFVYMEPTSPKGHDLRRDARYCMHCAVEDNSGGQGEFLISGPAAEVKDQATREQAFDVARAIGYDPQESYILFELSIDEAMMTVYEDGDPKRRRWKRDRDDADSESHNRSGAD